MFNKILRTTGALSLAVVLAASRAAAQQPAGAATVTGSVRDGSASAVRGASVRARQHDTGRLWQTTTDARGRFAFPSLPVGEYHLAVEAPGFAVANVNLTLTVGAELDTPIALTAAAEERVEVAVAAPLVETGRTQIASTVTPREIDALPLNGRNYLDLALLAPNVSRTVLRTNDRFAETSAVPGTGMSVAGQRNLNNAFVVDGLSANDDAADLAGVYLSEEVVREFEVVTSGGAAAFGRASGGTVSVVTRSGGNQLRGRAYEFFRNDALDAANPLAIRKDPLNQNQYGFTLGGPIVRDRTFWFGNVEHTGQARTGIVTITPASMAAVNAVLDRSGYGGPRVVTGNYAADSATTNVFGRLDHQAGRSHLLARYGFYAVRADNARNAGGLNDASRGAALENMDQTIAAALVTPLSSGALNEARLQYTRSRLDAPVNDPVGPAVNISGVASWGTATFSPTARNVDAAQAADAVTLQRGAHLLKGGADVLFNRLSIAFPGALQGVYTFSSLANFQRGAYTQFQQAFGDPDQRQTNPNLGIFVQDEWRPRAGLTVNAGVRYDLQWLPAPIELDANNIAPRLGVAWASAGGRTVVRASTGVYFDRIPLRATSNALQRDGTRYKTAVLAPGQPGAPVFPAVLPTFPAGTLVSITTIDPGIDDAYSRQASVQVERAIGSVATASVGYSDVRGRGLIMSRNLNVPTLSPAAAAALGAANLGRPNPSFANINQYGALGESWFHGVTAEVASRRLSWGSMRVSYTLSRALDDAGNAFFQAPQDNANILGDKGPSDNDQRHRIVLSGVIGEGASARVHLAGFQFGYLFSWVAGAPFNIVTGVDDNNDTTINDRPAGVGRNAGRMPATSSLDLRLSRAFRMTGAQRIEVMAEAFNVLNHANVLNVNNTFGTGVTPLASFGRPIVAGDPRQIQLGVRWTF